MQYRFDELYVGQNAATLLETTSKPLRRWCDESGINVNRQRPGAIVCHYTVNHFSELATLKAGQASKFERMGAQ
jgi:hypothetical protein